MWLTLLILLCVLVCGEKVENLRLVIPLIEYLVRTGTVPCNYLYQVLTMRLTDYRT